MTTPTALAATDSTSSFVSWKGDHVGIRVPDFDAAAAWYSKTLDFRVTHSMPLGEKILAFLSPAADDSFRIELIAGPGCSERPSFDQLLDTHIVGGWHHVCFRVDNVEANILDLKRRGVRIVSEPRDVPALGIRFAFFSDPWGNLFELMHPLGV